MREVGQFVRRRKVPISYIITSKRDTRDLVNATKCHMWSIHVFNNIRLCVYITCNRIKLYDIGTSRIHAKWLLSRLCLTLSLSLSIYIYIYIYICMCVYIYIRCISIYSIIVFNWKKKEIYQNTLVLAKFFNRSYGKGRNPQWKWKPQGRYLLIFGFRDLVLNQPQTTWMKLVIYSKSFSQLYVESKTDGLDHPHQCKIDYNQF